MTVLPIEARTPQDIGNAFPLMVRENVGALLPELEAISDDWLDRKKTREKGFSLGYFDEKYLIRFPEALIRKDGRIIARKVTSYADSGAYNRHTPYAVTKHSANVGGPYNIPNVWIDAYCVYTNRQPSSAMRGFGVTPASFALEVQMDKIAETVGMDPWEIRFINAWRDGDLGATQFKVEAAGLIEAMKRAAELAGVKLPAHLQAMNSRGR